jgi:hypothetical protein
MWETVGNEGVAKGLFNPCGGSLIPYLNAVLTKKVIIFTLCEAPTSKVKCGQPVVRNLCDTSLSDPLQLVQDLS